MSVSSEPEIPAENRHIFAPGRSFQLCVAKEKSKAKSHINIQIHMVLVLHIHLPCSQLLSCFYRDMENTETILSTQICNSSELFKGAVGSAFHDWAFRDVTLNAPHNTNIINMIPGLKNRYRITDDITLI